MKTLSGEKEGGKESAEAAWNSGGLAWNSDFTTVLWNGICPSV